MVTVQTGSYITFKVYILSLSLVSQSLYLCAVMLREEDSSQPDSLASAAIGLHGGIYSLCLSMTHEYIHTYIQQWTTLRVQTISAREANYKARCTRIM